MITKLKIISKLYHNIIKNFIFSSLLKIVEVLIKKLNKLHFYLKNETNIYKILYMRAIREVFKNEHVKYIKKIDTLLKEGKYEKAENLINDRIELVKEMNGNTKHFLKPQIDSLLKRQAECIQATNPELWAIKVTEYKRSLGLIE